MILPSVTSRAVRNTFGTECLPLILPAEGGRAVDHDAARELIRELKAVGGDLKTLRLALTGRDRGPELAALLEALPKDEALRRVDAAI